VGRLNTGTVIVTGLESVGKFKRKFQ